MVRRRPRKSGRSSTTPRPLNRKDAKLKRWDKPSDIPLDDEDQFFASRDEILLDGGHSDGDEDMEDDEVFSLQGISDNVDDDDEIEEEKATQQPNHAAKATLKKKASSKNKATKISTQSSSSEADSQSEEETWGRKKSAYYSSNAAEIESNDEEANELEEQEAKRLQRKARAPMMDSDFGLDDPVQAEADQGLPDIVVEDTPPVQSIPQDKISLIRHLEKNSPETLALARDWEDTALNLRKCKEKIDGMEADKADALSQGMIHLQYQALLTYATTLGFYLHLRAGAKYSQRPELLHTHPVFSRLLTLKRSLTTLENLDFAISDLEGGDNGADGMEDGESLDDVEQLWRSERKNGLAPGELDLLLEEAALPLPKVKRNVQFVEPPKKKRKTTKPAKKGSSALDPSSLTILPPLKLPSSRTHSDPDLVDSYGEATSLQFADAADKNARKKSLRFHTSKIESASMRRQGARNRAIGGDDDLPYKERRKEKDERLAKEARKKNRGQGGEDLDDIAPEADNAQQPLIGHSGEEIDMEETDGYYHLVKQRAKAKKEQKKADYEASKSLERIPDIEENASGPRSLTLAMLKNKGLTPRRSKEVRNPRVKKRKRFEKAKKKVSSQKAVYKGGIGDVGNYGGERSGISKVIKSVRLG